MNHNFSDTHCRFISEIDTSHFFGPESDPNHKHSTRDPTRLDANAMRYITLVPKIA